MERLIGKQFRGVNAMLDLLVGDIVFARTGATTGKSFLIRECPKDAVFASYLIRVRVSTSVDPGYLSHFFNSPNYWAQITQSARGVAQPGVNATTLKTLKLPLPPLPEQKRIAAILDKVDSIRRKRQEAVRLTEELLRSAFLEMFGDPVTNPKGWEVQQLADIVAPGRIVTYGIVQAGPHIDDGVPYIRTGDIQDGKIKIEGLLRTSKEIAQSYKRSEVNTGDLVMSIRATVGTIAPLPDELDGANLTQGTARISPGPTVMKDYLLWAIRSESSQQWIQKQVKGATFKEITLGKLRELPILVPPMRLQKEFKAISDKCNSLISNTITSMEYYDILFNTLLQRAFNGEL